MEYGEFKITQTYNINTVTINTLKYINKLDEIIKLIAFYGYM